MQQIKYYAFSFFKTRELYNFFINETSFKTEKYNEFFSSFDKNFNRDIDVSLILTSVFK